MFTQARPWGDYSLRRMITFYFLYRKKTKQQAAGRFVLWTSHHLAWRGDWIKEGSKEWRNEGMKEWTKQSKIANLNSDWSTDTWAELIDRPNNLRSKMDQRATASTGASSSAFKCVSTHRVVQIWSDRSHSLMHTKYSSTACHRSKILAWLCSPLIECISYRQVLDIYNGLFLASSFILRGVNYLGIYS